MVARPEFRRHLLVFVLLIFSGNPLATFLFGKWMTTVGLLICFGLLGMNKLLNKKFLQVFLIIAIVIVIITAAQFFTFWFVSWQGAFNLLLKIFLGGVVIYHFKERFSVLFFDVMYKLSIVSLSMFVLVNLLRVPIPFIPLAEEVHSYIVYGTSYDDHWFKNAGMFWEPGAHAGILTLCLALNFNRLGLLWKEDRFKIIVLVIALLTTQSTTGYLVGFLIALFASIKAKNKVVALIVLPVLFLSAWFLYENTDFLKDKIEGQYSTATESSIGEVSNTRFGSLVFDWHYIEKHPIIGNGLHEKTRFADHQYLFWGETGDIIGSGNGFSHYWASMGLIFIVGYFYLLRRAALSGGILFCTLLLLVVFLNLQGEQWLNFPLYLGLVFLVIIPSQRLKVQSV